MIRRIASENRLWGAERIRGELLKLGIRVSKRTIQRSLPQPRPARPRGQTWATFLHNYAETIWACEFLAVSDLRFRPLHAFFVIALGSRRVVHVGVTRHPTDAWVAQQLREATPFGEGPRFLLRDNDRKYGPMFAHVATASGIRVLRSPVRAPTTCSSSASATSRALREYVAYFNEARPHQGIGQRLPDPATTPGSGDRGSPVLPRPILGGLHHDYQRAA